MTSSYQSTSQCFRSAAESVYMMTDLHQDILAPESAKVTNRRIMPYRREDTQLQELFQDGSF